MPSIDIEFPNEYGGMISSILEYPEDNKVNAFALIAHGFTLSKNINAVKHLSQTMTQKGIAVMRFDFTGLGESTGDFSNTNFCTNIQDITTVAKFLSDNYRAPQILIGHSLGGAAMLSAAGQIPSSLAVSTIGAPSNPEHVTKHFKNHIPKILSEGQAEVKLGGKRLVIRKEFIEAFEEVNLKNKIKNLNKALLVFHSPQDSIVHIDNAASIYKAANHPKSFISLDGADHLLGKSKDSKYCGEVIASWASRYINPEPLTI